MNIEKTYCNPTPLPDYPIGRSCFYRDKEITFRETADPSVIYEDGKWYLYSSCGMAYWTEDFIHWNHEKLEETYDVGIIFPFSSNPIGSYPILRSNSQA